MATVNAAKKSRPSASDSASTTASRARRSRKSGAAGTADPTGLDDWLPRHQAEANEEGWGVFPCIDMKTRLQFVQIFYTDKRFDNDNKAREHVARMAKDGDALAMRAVRVVFQSRVPAKARSKK